MHEGNTPGASCFSTRTLQGYRGSGGSPAAGHGTRNGSLVSESQCSLSLAETTLGVITESSAPLQHSNSTAAPVSASTWHRELRTHKYFSDKRGVTERHTLKTKNLEPGPLWQAPSPNGMRSTQFIVLEDTPTSATPTPYDP
ncbi:hypothetical protein EYF80_003590 [Liparis tanakae]|uniref:Uncharacterized protein n=1 Tax=Liparis tanakae TaxID=230148 RepID=A0A4Z2J934_9TELE|nr:hypothetical protein EYF80_003590 [Liparis tanakae]